MLLDRQTDGMGHEGGRRVTHPRHYYFSLCLLLCAVGVRVRVYAV